MKILVSNYGSGHLTYSKMSAKPASALRSMGHEAIADPIHDIGQDLTIILGYTTDWEHAKDLPGKKIWWCHGANWSTHSNYKNENKKVWDLIRNCDAVCYQSEFAKHMAQKYLEFTREGPIILNAAEPDFRGYASIDKDINIATTAIWREWKRLKEMEEIIDVLNKENSLDKNYHLWVYGKIPGEKTYGDPQFIHYLGISDDFPKYYDCHLYMQLSFNDYSPATVGEAMAMGLPVICSNSGGSKDIVGDSGYVAEIDPFIDYSINCYKQYPQIDYKKVVDGIIQLVANLNKYRFKTRERVEKVANNKVSAQQLIDLYNSIK